MNTKNKGNDSSTGVRTWLATIQVYVDKGRDDGDNDEDDDATDQEATATTKTTSEVAKKGQNGLSRDKS